MQDGGGAQRVRRPLKDAASFLLAGNSFFVSPTSYGKFGEERDGTRIERRSNCPAQPRSFPSTSTRWWGAPGTNKEEYHAVTSLMCMQRGRVSCSAGSSFPKGKSPRKKDKRDVPEAERRSNERDGLLCTLALISGHDEGGVARVCVRRQDRRQHKDPAGAAAAQRGGEATVPPALSFSHGEKR